MEVLCWLLVMILFAVGLIGTVVPFLPGTTIILAAAVGHRLVLGPEQSVSWIVIAFLILLTAVSYGFDFLSSYFGAKYFGATKWATFGAIIGTLAGLFFGLPGLFIGPVAGAIAGEIIAGKRLIDAGRAGWGSLLGNLGGIVAKLLIGVTMIVIFLLNVPEPTI